MYEYLKGKIKIKNNHLVAIEVNGVGYRVNCSSKTIENLTDEGILYIHMHIREDAFNLYGFFKEEEREMFKLLINVSGIGAKLAIDILSNYTVEELYHLIKKDEIDLLTKIPGLGTKKAKKLIIEVKDKIPNPSDNLNLSMREEILMALQVLGYNKRYIMEKLKESNDFDYSSVQEGIKDILNKINQ